MMQPRLLRGAEPIIWLVALSLAVTPAAFAQGLPAEPGSAAFADDLGILIAQEDTAGPEPESAPEPATATEPDSAAESESPAQPEAAGEPEATMPAESTPESATESGEPSAPGSAEQALQQEGTPSLVSPDQLGEGGALGGSEGDAAPMAAGERKPSMMEKVPWWVWALAAAAVVVLAGALGGGGGGGGGNDSNDSGDGTVGYSW